MSDSQMRHADGSKAEVDPHQCAPAAICDAARRQQPNACARIWSETLTLEPVLLQEVADIVRPAHTALLVIDMQKDFCVEGFATHQAGRDLTATRSVIPAIRSLLDGGRKAGVLVVHIGFWTLPENLSNSGPWLAQRRRSTYSSEKVAIAGSEGADFITELAPLPGEITVHKQRYSGFKGTNLDLILRSHAIRSVVVTGVSTNVCVESTAREAFELDYYVVMPPDTTASWNMALHGPTLETIRHRFGTVAPSADLLSAWGSNHPAKTERTLP